MSALGDYYKAQTAERIASIPGLDVQNRQVMANTALVQQQGNDLQANDAARNASELSSAGLNNANALQVPANDAARRDAQGADAALARAQGNSIVARSPFDTASTAASTAATLAGTAGTQTRNQYLPAQLQSELTGQGLSQQQTQLGLQPIDLNTSIQQILNRNKTVGFAKGGIAGRDKAKPAKVDTVSAELEPGEAVLNKHAVDHYGSSVIDHMNRMGLMRQAAHKEVEKTLKGMTKRKAS